MKKLLALLLASLLIASPAWAAFPTVDASNTSSGGFETTTHTVSMPATCASGKTLLVLFSSDGTESVTWPGSWVELSQTSGVNPTLAIGYLKSTGAEAGGTIDVTTGTAETSRHITFCIGGATDPTVTAPEASSYSSATTSNPDPPSVTPTGGTKDYLWIGVTNDDNGAHTVSSWPSNYTDNQTTAPVGDSTTTNVYAATRTNSAASEDPGTFTMSGTAAATNAVTIAVHPAASTAAIFPQVIIVE